MDFLKKLFPMSFQKSSEVSNLVKRIVIYVVGAILVGVVIGVLLAFLYEVPVVPTLLSLLATVVEAYCTAGVVLAILVHCNVIKVGAQEAQTVEAPAEENNNTEA